MSVKTASTTNPSVRDRMIEEAFDLTRAIVADPSILDEIPEGVGIVTIREGADEEYVEQSIAAGLEAIRRGENVYFRHVRAGEWQAPDRSTVADANTRETLPMNGRSED
jgi:hypothetical protein